MVVFVVVYVIRGRRQCINFMFCANLAKSVSGTAGINKGL